MAAKIRQVFSLYRLYGAMDLRWFLQDTKVCLIVILCDLVSLAASLSGIFLLAVRFEGVGGLSADEVLFMLGFFTLGNGFSYMLFGFNVDSISRIVGRGQIDHMIIQPVPLWMQMLTMGFMPVSGGSGFWGGLLLTIIAMARLGLSVTPGLLLLMAVYLAARQGIVMGISFIAGSAAFYRPAAFEEVSSLTNGIFASLGKFPLSGMPAWLTGILTTVFPVGLTAWLPAMALLRKLNAPGALLLPVLAAAVLTALAAYLFRKGMRYYVKHGCNRYRDMGFRS